MFTLKAKFFIGDKVVNLEPHYDANYRLVKLNTIGFVETVGKNECNISWQIDQHPYLTSTSRNFNTIDKVRSSGQ